MSDFLNEDKSFKLTLGPSWSGVILTIVFLLLKVFDKVDWSYWIVFMPLWLPFAVCLTLFIAVYILKFIVFLIDSLK